MKHTTLCAASMAALSLCLASGAQAAQQGATPQGQAFVSGGVSDEEAAALHAQRERYTLWVVTAAKKTGAYLADVHVKVTDAQQKVVFDAPIDGPWLMIDLPLGRYVVEASFEGETQQHVTTIHPGDHHQTIFYFATEADVSPEPRATPPVNLFNGKR
ncbi:MAG TPA: carboxypeptidase regulatory-like domain-containing protein [Albitalea sp.]|nr:carboxypeptidase regulatory-like domain-containing protein [Albitalea sp.]